MLKRLRNVTFSFNLASDEVPTHMNVTFFYYWLCKKHFNQTGRVVSDTSSSKREHIILVNPDIYKVNLSSAVFFEIFPSFTWKQI